MSRERIVIIGGGFGGLEFAKKIDKKRFDVKLIDRNNYHSFAPLFYQVASSALEPAGITFPLRRECRRRSVRGCLYDMGVVKTVDTVRKVVVTDVEDVPYDKVVIAAGATNNFFGIEGLDRYVYTLKSVSQAIRCRNAILDNMERAALSTDPAERASLLTFAVIGGGPTGVEIAGALGEMKRYVVEREYPRIRPEEVKVVLYDGSDRVLGAMSQKSSDDALRYLKQLMVDVRLGKTMKSYDGHTVTFADGTTLDTQMVIWTAGITATPLEILGADVPRGPGGRLPVDEFNRVEGLVDVYAIGDICYHSDERFPRGCPQLAQPAIQQGRNLARNLNNPDRRKPFSYCDKGAMATVGRNRAVVDMGKVHIGGWTAWMAWMAVHLVTLLGMRNKVVVLLNWMWSYWSLTTSLRMILKPSALPQPRECRRVNKNKS